LFIPNEGLEKIAILGEKSINEENNINFLNNEIKSMSF
jgi:hypothetical protein